MHISSLVFFLAFTLYGKPCFAQEPYKRMLDDPMEFTGPESLFADAATLQEIRIGLFAPRDPEHALARSMLQGATLAVEQANKRGGYKGVPYLVVQRWTDGPWGSGSREMVRLVYGDRVWGVIGSISGDSTHVAQQIVTKARLPLVAPLSTDATLTHIRIPWIFRLTPNDAVQAELLVKEGIVPRALKRIGLISSDDHDSRMAAVEIQKALRNHGSTTFFHLTVPVRKEVSAESILQRILSFSADGLVLRLPGPLLLRLVSAMQNGGLAIPLFLPWIPDLDAEELLRRYRGTLVAVIPFPERGDCPLYQSFEHAYFLRFGVAPDPPATYTYDAMNLLIEGIQEAGLSRVGLREALVNLDGFEGASGVYRWDSGGGNVTKPALRVCEGDI